MGGDRAGTWSAGCVWAITVTQSSGVITSVLPGTENWRSKQAGAHIPHRFDKLL
jgi:hypothetical protein